MNKITVLRQKLKNYSSTKKIKFYKIQKLNFEQMFFKYA